MVDYALESGGVCAALRPLPNPGLRTSQPSGTCWGSCAARQAGHIGRSHPASNSQQRRATALGRQDQHHHSRSVA